MLLRTDLHVVNPITGENRAWTFQFESTKMDDAKWASLFPKFLVLVQSLEAAVITAKANPDTNYPEMV